MENQLGLQALKKGVFPSSNIRWTHVRKQLMFAGALNSKFKFREQKPSEEAKQDV